MRRPSGVKAAVSCHGNDCCPAGATHTASHCKSEALWAGRSSRSSGHRSYLTIQKGLHADYPLPSAE